MPTDPPSDNLNLLALLSEAAARLRAFLPISADAFLPISADAVDGLPPPLIATRDSTVGFLKKVTAALAGVTVSAVPATLPLAHVKIMALRKAIRMTRARLQCISIYSGGDVAVTAVAVVLDDLWKALRDNDRPPIETDASPGAPRSPVDAAERPSWVAALTAAAARARQAECDPAKLREARDTYAEDESKANLMQLCQVVNDLADGGRLK